MSDGDRDPFGMPLGGSTPAAPAPSPRPRVESDDRRERPRGPSGPSGRLLTLVFIVVSIAALAFVLYRSDQDALDSPAVINRELDGHALSAVSLVRAAPLRSALATLKADMAPDEELVGLRLQPTELSARVRDERGNVRLVDIDLSGDLDSTDWSTDTTSTPIDIAAIDPTAPERIVASALRQAGADDTHLEALSLSGSSSGAPSWYVSLNDVKIADQSWSADLAGIAVTHPGELPSASGYGGRSLLGPKGLQAALDQVSERASKVLGLRIAPQRLDATVRGDGKQLDLTIDAAQRLTEREMPANGGYAPFPVSRIDPDAPSRALKLIAERAGVSASRVDFVSLQDFSMVSGRQGWSWLVVFDQRVPQSRRTWRASLDGRTVKPL